MERVLLEAVDIIVKKFDPDKVILFGSRATGSAHRDSDYDLCILKSNLEHKRKTAQEIYKALLTLGIPVDVIVETPDNFVELKSNPFLIYENIAKNGEVLYEKQ